MSDANLYRSSQEMKHCKARDPLPYFKEKMLNNFNFSQEEVEALEKKANERVDEAVDFAANAKEPPFEALYEHVFYEELNNVVS